MTPTHVQRKNLAKKKKRGVSVRDGEHEKGSTGNREKGLVRSEELFEKKSFKDEISRLPTRGVREETQKRQF